MHTDEQVTGPKAVFLDTEVYVHQNFQYDAGLLAVFREHVRARRIQHLIVDVTVSEVRARIAQSVDDARAALRTYQNKARILRNSQSQSVRRSFRTPGRKRALDDLLKQFDDHLIDLDSHTVQVDSVRPSVVFDQYFNRDAPFHHSNKKSEFPDAFVVEALRSYADLNGSDVIVVTEDPDAYSGDSFQRVRAKHSTRSGASLPRIRAMPSSRSAATPAADATAADPPSWRLSDPWVARPAWRGPSA